MPAQRRILIVDDNDLMRTLLRGILRDSDFVVVGEARSGAAAVEMTERIKPDIVCLDVMMPEMNGIDALMEIKRKTPQVVVIMITGNASKENVQDALEFGASGFVVKPFNAATVLETIERAWQHAQRKSAAAG